MDVPFAPGAHSQNNGPREEPPASHVGRPYPSPPVRLDLKLIGRALDGDVLPDRVRPKGEPAEESENETTRKTRRKGPRRSGR
jgi:hypothetical protein